jgi:hypothetical protein
VYLPYKYNTRMDSNIEVEAWVGVEGEHNPMAELEPGKKYQMVLSEDKNEIDILALIFWQWNLLCW